jgi:hypothetical protein
MNLPKQEGMSGVRRVYGDEAAGPPLKRIKGGASLADLQTDYALFTYAPLFLFGGLEHNPVQEWLNIHKHGQVVYIFKLDLPVIHIGKGPEWDRTLWAVEKEYWPSLSLHIGSIALIDRRQKRLVRTICQDLPILDVAARTPSKCTITTFGVDSNLGCIAFAPAPHISKQPYIKFHPPREETIKLASALLQYDNKPYQHIQRPPWEKTNEDSDSST